MICFFLGLFERLKQFEGSFLDDFIVDLYGLQLLPRNFYRTLCSGKLHTKSGINMKRVLLFVSLELVVYSCTEDKGSTLAEQEPTKVKSLELITKSLAPPSLNLSQPFSEGTELGIFIYSGRTGATYKQRDEYKNVKAKAVKEKGRISWHKEPEVWLDSEPATVLAYAPYRGIAGLDARRIPVSMAPDAALTPAYMYGMHTLGHKKVNNVSPMVWLNMNYALSQITFRLARQKQVSGACVVSSFQIRNKAGGTLLCREGWLDLHTGRITGLPEADASTRLLLAEPVPVATSYGELPGLKVLPLSRKMNAGEIEALFTIDDKTYVFLFPATIQWKKGYTYTYQLLFNGNSLTFEKMTITRWDP